MNQSQTRKISYKMKRKRKKVEINWEIPQSCRLLCPTFLRKKRWGRTHEKKKNETTRQRQIDRQTGKQTGKPIKRYKGRQAGRQTEIININRPVLRRTDRQTDRQENRRKNSLTDRQSQKGKKQSTRQIKRQSRKQRLTETQICTEKKMRSFNNRNLFYYA